MKDRKSQRPAACIACAVMIVALSGTAWAQGTGRSLDIQPGARENGLGAAGVALPGDPCAALWWNPAALGFAGWYSAQWTSSNLMPGFLDDVSYHHVALAIPLERYGGIGASLTRVSQEPSLEETSPAFAAGYRLRPDLAVGLGVKHIGVELAPGSGTASTVGFDFGALYRKTFARGTAGFGVNVQNIGPDVKFENEDVTSPLSRNLKVGGAVTLPYALGADGFEAGVTVAIDFNQSLVTDQFRLWNGGVEVYGAYATWARVMLRGGYYNDDLGDIRDFTYGFGARAMGVAFDIAWIPQARNSDLDDVQKITLGLHTDALRALLASD
jgi:hypothetical protein